MTAQPAITMQMTDIGLAIIAFVWGQLSTQFFFRGWISFLGIVCCLIGLFRRKRPSRNILYLLWSKLSEAVFFFLILFTGFYILYYRLAYGKTKIEIFVYLISATLRLFFVLPQISRVLDDIWHRVMGPD
jgi:hypothetical protein